MTDGRVRFYQQFGNPGGKSVMADTASALFADGPMPGWAHLAFVADSTANGVGGLKIFLNGVAQTLGGNNGNTAGVSFSSYTNGRTLYIGACHNYNGSVGGFLSGLIDEVQIHSAALTAAQLAQAMNTPPVVEAGANQTITLPTDTATLTGTVSDDGLPAGGEVTQTWSKLSGPGTVTFAGGNAVDTTATFSTAGTYVLQLAANDTALTTTDTLTITVNPQPAARGDFDGDGSIDIADVNAIYAVLGTNVPPTDAKFDLTNDGKVDIADARELVEDVIGTSMADTNLDHTVDILDLGNMANEYDQSGAFGDGDTDGSGVIDILDLGHLANDYGKTY
jgi:hypothetical protein